MAAAYVGEDLLHPGLLVGVDAVVVRPLGLSVMAEHHVMSAPVYRADGSGRARDLGALRGRALLTTGVEWDLSGPVGVPLGVTLDLGIGAEPYYGVARLELEHQLGLTWAL